MKGLITKSLTVSLSAQFSVALNVNKYGRACSNEAHTVQKRALRYLANVFNITLYLS
jgi:hypothetical protein